MAGGAPSSNQYSWEILVPAHRYVFAVENQEVLEFDQPGDLPAERFERYQSLKAAHPVHGMIAWPNTVLLRGPATVVVDPGLSSTQGPPLLLALAKAGLRPESIDLVVNTHGHEDHVEANVYFPSAVKCIHELDAPLLDAVAPAASRPLRRLHGDAGEVAPGLRFLRTPGHSRGSIGLLAETGEGLLVVAGDTVGPLPRYFLDMDLPPGFPGREQLLSSWRAIRGLDPAIVIPGHNPPLSLSS